MTWLKSSLACESFGKDQGRGIQSFPTSTRHMDDSLVCSDSEQLAPPRFGMPSRRVQAAFAAVCVGVVMCSAIFLGYPGSKTTAGSKTDVMEGGLQNLVEADACHPMHNKRKRLLVNGFGGSQNHHRAFLEIDGRHYLYATTHAHGMYLNFQGVPGAGNCDVYKLQQDNHKWVSWSGSKNWLRAGYEHKHAMPILFKKAAKTPQGNQLYHLQHKDDSHWWISYNTWRPHKYATRAYYHENDAMNIELRSP